MSGSMGKVDGDMPQRQDQRLFCTKCLVSRSLLNDFKELSLDKLICRTCEEPNKPSVPFTDESVLQMCSHCSNWKSLADFYCLDSNHKQCQTCWEQANSSMGFSRLNLTDGPTTIASVAAQINCGDTSPTSIPTESNPSHNISMSPEKTDDSKISEEVDQPDNIMMACGESGLFGKKECTACKQLREVSGFPTLPVVLRFWGFKDEKLICGKCLKDKEIEVFLKLRCKICSARDKSLFSKSQIRKYAKDQPARCIKCVGKEEETKASEQQMKALNSKEQMATRREQVRKLQNICVFWKKGHCVHGKNCIYIHDGAPGRDPKLSICVEYRRSGLCRHGAKCRNSHDLSTIPCRHFNKSRFDGGEECSNGDLCPFSHQKISLDEFRRFMVEENESRVKPTEGKKDSSIFDEIMNEHDFEQKHSSHSVFDSVLNAHTHGSSKKNRKKKRKKKRKFASKDGPQQKSAKRVALNASSGPTEGMLSRTEENIVSNDFADMDQETSLFDELLGNYE
eukprot:221285_1